MKKRSKRFPNRQQLLIGGQLVYGLSQRQIDGFFRGVQINVERREKFMCRFTIESEARLKARRVEVERLAKRNSENLKRWRAARKLRQQRILVTTSTEDLAPSVL
jgi:hypothetical protein